MDYLIDDLSPEDQAEALTELAILNARALVSSRQEACDRLNADFSAKGRAFTMAEARLRTAARTQAFRLLYEAQVALDRVLASVAQVAA